MEDVQQYMRVCVIVCLNVNWFLAFDVINTINYIYNN